MTRCTCCTRNLPAGARSDTCTACKITHPSGPEHALEADWIPQRAPGGIVYWVRRDAA